MCLLTSFVLGVAVSSLTLMNESRMGKHSVKDMVEGRFESLQTLDEAYEEIANLEQQLGQRILSEIHRAEAACAVLTDKRRASAAALMAAQRQCRVRDKSAAETSEALVSVAQEEAVSLGDEWAVLNDELSALKWAHNRFHGRLEAQRRFEDAWAQAKKACIKDGKLTVPVRVERGLGRGLKHRLRRPPKPRGG